MARSAPTSIADHFRKLPDPRVRRTRRHALVDILVITLCAAICGADDRVAIARFGRAKRKWLCVPTPRPGRAPPLFAPGDLAEDSDVSAFVPCH